MKPKGIIIIPLTIFLLTLSTALSLTAHFVNERRKSLIQIKEIQRSLNGHHNQETKGQVEWRVIWRSKNERLAEKKRRISADFGGP